MDKVKVGIIGIGNMGSAHAANINKGKVPNMELAALCDIAEGRREYCKRNYPNVPVFKTSDELIESGYNRDSALFSSADCDKGVRKRLECLERKADRCIYGSDSGDERGGKEKRKSVRDYV